MRTLGCLLLMGMVAAQNPSVEGSHPPIPKKPFQLDVSDLPSTHQYYQGGTIHVEFIVNENGDVEDAIVVDTFDVRYSTAILERIMDTKYIPAHQNGIPVRVRYKLPIAFR